METNEFERGAERLSRRTVLTTATAAASAVAGMSARAVATPAAVDFGAPIAELHFPVGALSIEQKAAMIKGVTEVLINATKLAPDEANKLWVQIFETAEGGWGLGGKVVVPHGQ
jgi:4-oxalocrotonate tautomerase